MVIFHSFVGSDGLDPHGLQAFDELVERFPMRPAVEVRCATRVLQRVRPFVGEVRVNNGIIYINSG